MGVNLFTCMFLLDTAPRLASRCHKTRSAVTWLSWEYSWGKGVYAYSQHWKKEKKEGGGKKGAWANLREQEHLETPPPHPDH
jgi:hypothetical protein